MNVAPSANFPSYKLAPLSALIPYARNARTHTEAQVAQIAASIREFGFTNPVLVDAGCGVIAGHGRLLAARKLGMMEVPTIELRHLTPAQRRAYVLADNRLALSAGWDEDLLRIELGDLQADGFDLALTGFDPDELAGFLTDPTIGLTDPDDVPAAPEVPVSRLGDLWQLGRHRLVCGDSTDAATVERVLNGVRPHLMVTDPPYGVEYDPAWRNRAGLGSTQRVGKVENDHRATGARLGRCSLAVSHTSGMVPCTPRRWRKASLHAISRSGLKSFGRKIAWCSAGVITIGSMNRASTPCAARATGSETASRRPSGRSPAGRRTQRRSTAPRSRLSACAGH